MKTLWAPWRMQYLLGDAGEAHCIFCEEGRSSPWVMHVGHFAEVVMNRFPYANGHVMVAPLRHVSAFETLREDELTEIGQLTIRTVKVLNNMMKPAGFNIGYNVGAAAGAGIAGHLHEHVVPRWESDTNFMPVLAETRVIPEHLEDTAERFRALFQEVV